MRLERPTRTREHWLADLSVNYVERFFLAQGHSVERVQNDYGYDLYVETYDYGDDPARRNGTVENDLLCLQLKATERLNVLADGETIAFPVLRRHLAFWQKETMPVLLIVYAAAEERAYWLYVQQYLHRANINLETSQHWVTLRLPKQNVLDAAAIATFREFKKNIKQRIDERSDLHG